MLTKPITSLFNLNIGDLLINIGEGKFKSCYAIYLGPATSPIAGSISRDRMKVYLFHNGAAARDFTAPGKYWDFEPISLYKKIDLR